MNDQEAMGFGGSKGFSDQEAMQIKPGKAAKAGFSDEEALAYNPAAAEAEAPGFLTHMGGLLKNVNMMGATPQTQVIPNEVVTQFVVGAEQSLVNAPETFWRERVMAEETRDTPETRARLAELKEDRKVAGEIIQEAQKGDSPTAKLVGQAVQSLPGSMVSLAGAAVLPLPAALALGVGSNVVLETAGDYVQRRDYFEQTPEEAEGPALMKGVVAGGLELTTLGPVMKYMKGGVQGGAKVLAKVGAGEFAQEGATSLYGDLATNYQGLTHITPEQMVGNAVEAGAVGMLMVPMMAPGVKVIQLAKAKRAEAAFDETAAVRELQTSIQQQQALARGLPPEMFDGTTPIPVHTTPLTPQEQVLATLQSEQLRNGLDAAATPEGVAYGERIRNALEQNGLGQGAAEIVSEAADEGGMTPAVMERRKRTAEINALPFDLRPVSGSTDGAVLGLNLQQTGELPAGAVVMVGENPELFPQEVYVPMLDSLATWVQKYMPNARVILNLEQLGEGKFGAHVPVLNEASGEWTHIITPRELPSFKYQGGDAQTRMAVVTALTHEFGHALKVQNFFSGLQATGMDAKGLNALKGLIKTGTVPLELLDGMTTIAPEEAGLLKSWQELRAGVLEGRLTARDFVENWVGTRKLGDSVNPLRSTQNKTLYSWAERMLAKEGKNLDGATALELVEAAYGDPMEALNFDEYMAEQFSRAAWGAGDLQGSAIGKFFSRTMEQLRDLFRTLKSSKGVEGERMIAPGTTFQTWLDSQTRRAAAMEKGDGKFALSKQVKAAQKKLLAAKGLTPTGKVSKAKQKKEKAKPPEQVPVPEYINAVEVDEKSILEDMAYGLESAGNITEGQLDRYLDKIQRGELTAVRASLQRVLGEDVNWDREYTSKVLAKLPNKEKIKAETLRSYTKMGDVKAQEREMWEQFLKRHPNGFSMAQAKWALAQEMMPLEPRVYTEYKTGPNLDLVRFGMERVGFSPLDSTASTLVWEAPTQVSGDNHFNNPNYVAHSRRVDQGDNRFVLEIQSDLMQRREEPLGTENQTLWATVSDNTAEYNFLEVLEGDMLEAEETGVWSEDLKGFAEVTQAADLAGLRQRLETERVARKKRLDDSIALAKEDRENVWWDTKKLQKMKNDWWQRAIREEVAEANKDGRGRLYFPTADTLAVVEGWEKVLPMGVQIPFETPVTLDTGDKAVALLTNGELGYGYVLENGEQEFWGDPKEGRDAELVKAALTKVPLGYGDRQGIYDRYKRDIAKFLKREYGAVEEEHNGHDWLAFDPSHYGESVIAFDRENPYGSRSPEVVLAEFAGLSQEEYRNPQRVAEAAGFWERLGFDSPYFKRWGGNTQVLGADGKPLVVYRGTGGKVTFLDKTGRGGLTGVSSAAKAFWFSDNQANAQWYAAKAQERKYRPLEENYKREMQKLRRQLEEAVVLREELDRGTPQRKLVEKRIDRLRGEMKALRGDKDKTVPAQAVVQGHFLNMSNPLVVDMESQVYQNSVFTGYLERALVAGHDGVIFKNTFDPLGGTMYAIFEPEQAKVSSNVGTFDPTDEMHWDQESAGQQGARTVSKLLQKFWVKEKLTAGNLYAKMVDSLMQLQQVAASQPEDYNLQTFMKKLSKGMQLKNNLLKPAEDLVQKLAAIGGQSAERVGKLHGLLKEEWKSGELQTKLKGYDYQGQEVWGEEVGMGLAEQAQVERWEVQDTAELRGWMQKQGVDVTTEEGKIILELYLENRNLFLYHFNELGKGLKRQAAQAYVNAPELQKRELGKINELITGLLLSPFVPQGNFGRYVLIVKQDQGPVAFGQRRMKVVFRKHYENKADMQQAYLAALKANGANLGVQVTTQELEEQTGIPMQLPSDLLERLGHTGEFTDEGLETLANVMSVSKYSRIAEKYEKLTTQMAGGEENYTRVLADFAGRNANYIWKMQYRYELQQSISASKHLVRRMEKEAVMAPEEQVMAVDRARRNIAMMQSSLGYLMNPPAELQGMRSFITLVYLAYNVKTALMNVSTTINTWAAVTSEYGEIQGNVEFAKSLQQTGELLLYRSRRETALAKGAAQPTLDDAMMNELTSVLDQATQDGVIDQSYAYYLAAQADSGALLSATKGKMSQVGHAIAELGMMPFQATEKLNRIHSLITFYKLERKVGANTRDAYSMAVQKTNLLQNAYDQANRPELFRGKKAALTMFMSYVQFMGWISTGGYERAAKVQATALGRSVAPAYRGATAKIWLMFLLLGGLMGVPFARNLMDIVQWLWRKLGFGNAEAELRAFMEELGVDANFAMHGLLHDMAGFSTSGSFGLGRMLPGTDLLVKEKEMTSLETIGSLVTASSGPAGNFYKSVLEAIGTVASDPFTGRSWVEGGKKMPGAIGNVSKAVDMELRQRLKPTYGVTTKDVRRMTWDEAKGEFRDITTKEIFGQALGFAPTILVENREKNFAVQSEVFYWQGRRSDLMDRYWQAVRSGDEKLRAEVVKAQDEFSKNVPDRKLRITPKDRNESLRTHRKQVAAGEKFGTTQGKYKGVAEEVGGSY